MRIVMFAVGLLAACGPADRLDGASDAATTELDAGAVDAPPGGRLVDGLELGGPGLVSLRVATAGPPHEAVLGGAFIQTAVLGNEVLVSEGGSVDGVVISAVAASDSVELPQSCAFSSDAPALISFAPGGGLDRRLHREPLRFGLEFLDGKQVPIQISLYGGVE